MWWHASLKCIFWLPQPLIASSISCQWLSLYSCLLSHRTTVIINSYDDGGGKICDDNKEKEKVTQSPRNTGPICVQACSFCSPQTPSDLLQVCVVFFPLSLRGSRAPPVAGWGSDKGNTTCDWCYSRGSDQSSDEQTHVSPANSTKTQFVLFKYEQIFGWASYIFDFFAMCPHTEDIFIPAAKIWSKLCEAMMRPTGKWP